MEIKNTFETPADVDTTWRLLTNVEKVASCMPGAELTEMKDDGTFRGKVKVKIGPISLSFSGEASFEELDESAKLMKMNAGQEKAIAQLLAAAGQNAAKLANAAAGLGQNIDIQA